MKTSIFILLFLFRIQVSAQPLTSDIKKEIITQINEFRKVTGDSPGQTLKITRTANLDKAAQFHSDWLANSGLALATVNHHIETKSVNGQPKLVNCWDRGKYFKVAVFAEILFPAFPITKTCTYKDRAQLAVKLWAESTHGHRETMLVEYSTDSKYIPQIGVGMTQIPGTDNWVIVVVFGDNVNHSTGQIIK
jgi:uncharacterized protein YkwD